MNESDKNQQLSNGKSLPNAGDASVKQSTQRFPRVGTGVLLAGSALIGCFAVAVWNRKALVSLVRSRSPRRDEAASDRSNDRDAIY